MAARQCRQGRIPTEPGATPAWPGIRCPPALDPPTLTPLRHQYLHLKNTQQGADARWRLTAEPRVPGTRAASMVSQQLAAAPEHDKVADMRVRANRASAGGGGWPTEQHRHQPLSACVRPAWSSWLSGSGPTAATPQPCPAWSSWPTLDRSHHSKRITWHTAASFACATHTRLAGSPPLSSSPCRLNRPAARNAVAQPAQRRPMPASGRRCPHVGVSRHGPVHTPAQAGVGGPAPDPPLPGLALAVHYWQETTRTHVRSAARNRLCKKQRSGVAAPCGHAAARSATHACAQAGVIMDHINDHPRLPGLGACRPPGMRQAKSQPRTAAAHGRRGHPL